MKLLGNDEYNNIMPRLRIKSFVSLVTQSNVVRLKCVDSRQIVY